MPPTSAQWPLDCAKAMISPSTKIGRMMRDVVEVRAAEVGVVDREHVARVDVVAERLDHGLAVKCSVPTCTAMSWLPCMTVLPSASHSADEKSRA